MFSTEFLITSLIVVLIPGTGVIFTVSTALLQGRTAGVPDRHLSVGAALDWTVRLLPTTSIDVLTQVSVFEAPFSLGAALGVIDPTTDVPDLLDRLSDLVDVQLLALDVADPDEPRFALSAPG